MQNDQFYADQAQQMSGTQQASAGMAPYPLYGLGQEEAIPFYRQPWFCLTAGGAMGFGAAYLLFMQVLPRLKPNKAKKKKLDEATA